MDNNKTKNALIIVLVLSIICLSVSFFLQKETMANNQKGKDTAKREIKIGVILPLSGNLSKVGSDVEAALNIAGEDLKMEFPNVRLILEDDGFSPTKAVSAFNRLNSLDGVDAVIGPLNGSAIESVRPLAAQNQIVSFTPWGAGNRIGDYVIKNSVEADKEAAALAHLAVNELGLKKLGILYLENDWGVLQYQSFRDEIERSGGTLVAAESFVFGAKDFRDQITKIKEKDVDGLYIVNNGAGVGLITRQAAELGLDVQFFGQYATESSDLIGVGGDSLEGLVYSFPIDEANLTQEQAGFIARFKEEAGGKPQVAAYNAYDIYEVLVRAISVCQSGDGECISQKILSLEGYGGVGGNISYVNKEIERPIFFKTIKGGEFVPFLAAK